MSRSLPCFLLLLLMLFLALQHSFSDPRVSIVYMGSLLEDEVESIHMKMLQEVVGERANETLLRSFRSFNGFIALLTPEELQDIAGLEGVVSAFESTENYLHTTKSWDFLGFPENITRNSTESDIIVGIIDTGVWPNSSSFDDTGFGPPPAKWKGSCETSSNFTCNNKLIGARYYNMARVFGPGEVRSPVDTHGHGSHTASTVAGNVVEDVSMLRFGSGTARGGVPSARIAVYKACWSITNCQDADIILAFDDAIADGVDVISASIGPSTNKDYVNDSLAIGSFHAMQNGILTSTSGGNNGPNAFTVANVAPWLLTVAASTIDREFNTGVLLGNNMSFQGVSINTCDMNGTLLPLIRGRDAPNVAGGFDSLDSALCKNGSLDQNLVEGKIVLCEIDIFYGDEVGVVAAGASGTVMLGSKLEDFTVVYPLPASYVSLKQNGSSDILSYINSTRNPTATISRSNELPDTLAPYIVSFSSRGPNTLAPQILKPDIAAPGVNILAAWSPTVPPSEVAGDTRVVNYNFQSGTSMACPHATAAAAYVKAFNPTWSPAAIKSALMTTAHPMNSSDENHQNGLAFGAGNINPKNAIDPGLIYNASMSDFVAFLCGQGYNTSWLQWITRDNSTCSAIISSSDLNLPSFALFVPPNNTNTSVEFHRRVTNVGPPQSTYVAKIATSWGLNVEVEPKTLTFASLGETQTFVVKIGASLRTGESLSGTLVWDDGVHQVRSPIVAFA